MPTIKAPKPLKKGKYIAKPNKVAPKKYKIGKGQKYDLA